MTSDISHIIILKHISALARTLCDTLKMIAPRHRKTHGHVVAELMWLLGKIFWHLGAVTRLLCTRPRLLAILPPLAEAWHPGFFGSWLMLPAIFAVVYGMLMFKNGVFLPITYGPDEDGVWRVQEHKEALDEEDEMEEIAASLDDPFYMAAFRSKKLKRRNRRMMQAIKARAIPLLMLKDFWGQGLARPRR